MRGKLNRSTTRRRASRPIADAWSGSESIVAIARLEDARDGINKMGWCGRSECGFAVTERTGMAVLGTPYYREAASGKCIVCGEPATNVLYAAKAY